MGRFLLRRLLISIPVLLGITIATYLMLNLTPGDPAMAMIDPEVAASLGPGWVEQQREALGLHRPLPIRYAYWLRETAQGNLGYSYNDRQPIAPKILERIWPTVKLMLTVQLIALTIAVPIGVISAIKQYSFIDYVATIFGFASISIPSFFLGLGAIYVFALQLGWFPTAGMGRIDTEGSILNSLHHLVLPSVVLGLAQSAPLIRYTRSSMLETIRQDYVRVARAKGLQERAVLIRHALRNALIPLITIVALDIPTLLGGTVIIEQVFSWPGMGTLAISAVLGRDYPVIMAITLIMGVVIVISNLIADLLYAVVDPRIKYS